MSEPTLDVTVVIPTYGRPELLRRALDALGRQTLPAARFEVVVVDDGGEPAAEPQATGFSLRLVRKPNGGLAAARNAGVRLARGRLVVFMDDDIEAAPEFLEAHLAAHAEPGVAALGALPYPPDLELTPFLHYLERVRHYDLFLRYPDGVIPMPPLNGNSSIERSVFDAAGGYEEGFSTYGGEDTELGYRLCRRGVRFVYAPRARGFHRHTKGYAEMRRDMRSSGRALVAIVERYPELRARVSLDLVVGPLSRRTPGRLVKRGVFLGLHALPVLVDAIEWGIARLEGRGWKRLLYPLYLVGAHYHYGEGVRQELGRLHAARAEPGATPG